MLYVVLIGLALIALLSFPFAIFIALVYAYTNLSTKNFLSLLALLIVIPLAAFKTYERNFMLSVVPEALQVNSIVYSKEESWGFGPGGNEAGIRTYPLKGEIANLISIQGIEFFNSMPANQKQANRDWRGRYGDWAETPISSISWKNKEETGSLDIYDYICAYGFCIDIDDAVVKEATQIMNSKGSYYAYGRIGLIVVSPSRKLVLYMYNG
jgi:hypothetical protein